MSLSFLASWSIITCTMLANSTQRICLLGKQAELQVSWELQLKEAESSLTGGDTSKLYQTLMPGSIYHLATGCLLCQVEENEFEGICNRYRLRWSMLQPRQTVAKITVIPMCLCMTFMCRHNLRLTLCGFTSLCMMPCEWQKSKPCSRKTHNMPCCCQISAQSADMSGSTNAWRRYAEHAQELQGSMQKNCRGVITKLLMTIESFSMIRSSIIYLLSYISSMISLQPTFRSS